MALVYNATEELQSFKAAGNWFTFKPKQMKQMDDAIAHFIATERQEFGMVLLPEELSDPEYKASPEGKELLEQKTEQGINSFVSALRQVIYNNQVSLRQDLQQANIQADPASFASDGELKAMELVAKYQRAKNDDEQKKIDKVKELMKTVGSVSK